MPECNTAKLEGVIWAVISQDQECTLAGGYHFHGFTSLPTASQISKMCSNADCQTTLQAARAGLPDECTMPFTDYAIHAQIIDPIVAACGGAPAPVPAPATTPAPPPPTTPAPPPPTATPPTTASPTVSPTAPPPTPVGPPSDSSTGHSSASAGSSGDDVSAGTNLTASTLPPPLENNNGSSDAANKTPKTSNGGMGSTTILGIIAGVVMVVALIACLAFRAGRKKNKALQPPYVAIDSATTRDRPVNGTSSSRAIASRPAQGSANKRASLGGNAAATAAGASSLWTDREIEKARFPLEDLMVGDVLSQGAFGEVLRGSYNGEPVAIKRLLPARRKNMSEIESFLDEAKLLTTLRHPRIVGFVGVAWDSLTDLCLVTELMDGGDLRSLLAHAHAKNEPTGFDASKVKIALHISHALSYLHGLRPLVVHRDLKSKNVLLTRDLDAKLTDFGVSRARAEKTMTAGVGSSLWMAPEVMMGERYDEKADVFSFGVVLSELDSQQLPYAHAAEPGSDRPISEMAVLNMVASGRLTVAFSDGADPDIVATGRACVALNPTDRPTASEVLYRMHQIYRGYTRVELRTERSTTSTSLGLTV